MYFKTSFCLNCSLGMALVCRLLTEHLLGRRDRALMLAVSWGQGLGTWTSHSNMGPCHHGYC